VDVGAIMAAAAMLAFSIAPSYTFIHHQTLDPAQCAFIKSPAITRNPGWLQTVLLTVVPGAIT